MSNQTHSGTGHNVQATNVHIGDFPQIASDLALVVNILGKRLFCKDELQEKESRNHFSPDVKIRHNNVIRFKGILENYRIYVGKLITIYREFDEQGTYKTPTVLENITISYLKNKSKLISAYPQMTEIELIRNHADDLIEAVEGEMKNQIVTSSNLEATSESVNISLQIVLIDAFIRCKILEEPPQDATA